MWPWKRRCCEVPLLVGGDQSGDEVTGLLRVGDVHVEFKGIVYDPDEPEAGES